MPDPHKVTLGDRFYIYSHNPVSPVNRVPHAPNHLVVLTHGVALESEFAVRQVAEIRFWAGFNEPADVEEVEQELQGFALHHWRTDNLRRFATNAQCPDYTLKKEEGKKPWRGCCCGAAEATSSFADSLYINSQMQTVQHNFDVVGLHNHWYNGRTVLLSQLMNEVAIRLAGRYTHLLCGFCRNVH